MSLPLFSQVKSSSLGCFLRTSPSLVKLLLDPRLPIARKRDCVDFFLNGSGVNRLIASLPRAGYHYLNLMIDVALDLEAGGDGSYHFNFGWFHSAGGHHGIALDWRWKAGKSWFSPVPPIILNTHMPYYLNSCLKMGRMKTVIMVRNIWDVLESIVYHYDLDSDVYDAFLRRKFHPNANPDAKIDFLMFIEFFDTWGNLLGQDNVMVMHYEDLNRDPVAELSRFRDHMELDISNENLSLAATLCGKQQMKETIGETDEKIVRVRFENQDVQFTDRQIAFIREKLCNSRYRDFGCSLELSDAIAS